MSYIIGQNKATTSRVLRDMALSRVYSNDGFLYFGDKAITRYFPRHRISDVVVIDQTAPHPTPIQFLKHIDPAALKDLFRDLAKYPADASTERFDRTITALSSALSAVSSPTLLDMSHWLLSDDFRHRYINNITDPYQYAYWTLQYEKWSARTKEERTESALAQVDKYTLDPEARLVLCYPNAKLHIPTLLAEKKIVIVHNPSRTIGVSILSTITDQTIFIDDLREYKGSTLIRAVEHNTVHLTNTSHTQLPREIGDALLNRSEENIVLRLAGDDVERFDRWLKITNTQRTSTGKLGERDCYRGGKVEPLPLHEFRVVPGVAKAIKAHTAKHYQVSRRTVERAINQKAKDAFTCGKKG